MADHLAPHSGRVAPGARGRPPVGAEALLRIHFMNQWLNFSAPAMGETLHHRLLFRDFGGPKRRGAGPIDRLTLQPAP
jgi:Transposase domain (DUF772)